ncbi:MAG: hypothetical protein Q8R72_07015, partial [Hylemonella sp.]|nr:hypothetical protein [Hylemonella sp.]
MSLAAANFGTNIRVIGETIVVTSSGGVRATGNPSTGEYSINAGIVGAAYNSTTGEVSGDIRGIGVGYDPSEELWDFYYQANQYYRAGVKIQDDGPTTFYSKITYNGASFTETISVSLNPAGGINYSWTEEVKIDGKTAHRDSGSGHIGAGDVSDLFGGMVGQAAFLLRNRGRQIDGIVDAAVNGKTTQAINWVPPRRDPLVLDIDGGGITTSGINPNSPILFDQDGDGIQTATGWIASGEAIVVRDLNGNGTIDSGRELFGDNTLLTSGPNAGQTAANGFEALADLDRDANGVADGKFDSNDVAYAGVKLWKDANQDGISQADELYTFDQLGVASINLSNTTSNVNLGGGNTQTHTGSFTRTDGTDGESGTAQLAGSLLLVNNNFFSEFTDDPALTAEALALPEMQGSGFVRDLRAAMSLAGVPLESGGVIGALDLGTATLQEHLAGSATSWYAAPVQQRAQVLQAQLGQFASRQTKAEQMADLDNLIYAWGRTSTMETSVQTNRTQALVMPDMLPELTAIEQFAVSNPTLYAQLTALEQFNGMNILERWVQTTRSWQWRETTGAGQWVPVDTSTVVMSGPQQQFLQQAYDALKESVYGALVAQTRLKPYLDAIDLTIDETGVHFDFSGSVTLVQEKAGLDLFNAVTDLIDLHKFAGDTTQAVGWNPYLTLKEVLAQSVMTPEVELLLASERIVLLGSEVISYSASNAAGETVLGNAEGNQFNGGAGADTMYGLGGNDTLNGHDGNDLLYGGAGNDTLNGGNGTNVLDGGDGDDVLRATGTG